MRQSLWASTSYRCVSPLVLLRIFASASVAPNPIDTSILLRHVCEHDKSHREPLTHSKQPNNMKHRHYISMHHYILHIIYGNVYNVALRFSELLAYFVHAIHILIVDKQFGK